MNEYETRYVENLLDEVLGGATPPDLSEQILRRRDALPANTPVFAFPDDDEHARDASGGAAQAPVKPTSWRTRLPVWTAAAGVVVGLALIIFGEERHVVAPPVMPPTSLETPVDAENTKAAAPSSVILDVHGDAALFTLPPSTRALRVFGMTDVGASVLERFSDLRYLEVRRSDDLSDEGVLAVCGIRTLEELHLVVTHELRTSSWAALSNLRNLRSLGLYSIWLPDGALDVLAGLPSLRRLDLSGCMNLTDKGFARLGALKKLEALRLDFCCRITDEGLAAVGKLTSLRELDLDNCWRISDEGMGHIAHLHNLESLTLRLCVGVTDAGLKDLAPLERLRRLNLQDCSGVTAQGVDDLRRVLPACSMLTGTRTRKEEGEE